MFPDVLDFLLDIAKTAYAAAHGTRQPRAHRSRALHDLYSMRNGRRRERRWEDADGLGLEILSREIGKCRENNSHEGIEKILLVFLSLIWDIGKELSIPVQELRALTQALSRNLSTRPSWLVRHLPPGDSSRRASPAAIQLISGLNESDWDHLNNRVSLELKRAQELATGTTSTNHVPVFRSNFADDLFEIGVKRAQTQDHRPAYDSSQSHLKICRLKIHGFRGASGSFEIDLTRDNKPLDLLLWADNGSGKSSIIDGIEFGLQGRVDRSRDFNGGLSSKLRNLNSEETFVEIELSDASVIRRSVVVDESGNDSASTLEVSAGFRISPLVIRRSDILRFLDTDSTRRGSIFFDYFPEAAGEDLGVRPDEHLRNLEEAQTRLGVRRRVLASRLRAMFPDQNLDFEDWNDLTTFKKVFASRLVSNDVDDTKNKFDQSIRDDVDELTAVSSEYRKNKRILSKGVQHLNPEAYRDQLSRITPALATVSENLTDAFKEISGASHVCHIHVYIGLAGPTSLDVVVEFNDGQRAVPQQIFSEGFQDLIAVLFFLYMSREAALSGQAKILVLDDALQSVDSSIRSKLMEFVLREFSEWQLLVTGHDEAWKILLTNLFRTHRRNPIVVQLSSWEFSRGIAKGPDPSDGITSLRSALEREDNYAVSTISGKVLEQVASELSWRFNISVKRKQDDRYTLGELWPGVLKALRDTSVGSLAQHIDSMKVLRNLLSAHFNPRAEGISIADRREFARAIIEFVAQIRCPLCEEWAEVRESTISCRCGELKL